MSKQSSVNSNQSMLVSRLFQWFVDEARCALDTFWRITLVVCVFNAVVLLIAASILAAIGALS
jgi:hypothetical protein